MIHGAVIDKKLGAGTLTPEQFSKATIWQMKHLYGFSGASRLVDVREAYLKRCRILGLSAFETWRRWKLEIQPEIDRNKKP